MDLYQISCPLVVNLVSTSMGTLYGGRKKFNVDFIVKTEVFLYNWSVAGELYVLVSVA